jgi:hypothetical protein
MRRAHVVSTFLVVAVCLSSCRDSTGPEYKRLPGLLSLNPEEPARITVPTEATAGVPIAVTVITMGGGCVTQGDTEAHVTGLAADVTPYDTFVVSLPPNMACTDELRLFTHTTTVAFAAPGTAVLRIHGRAHPDVGLITVERTVQIR